MPPYGYICDVQMIQTLTLYGNSPYLLDDPRTKYISYMYKPNGFSIYVLIPVGYSGIPSAEQTDRKRGEMSLYSARRSVSIGKR